MWFSAFISRVAIIRSKHRNEPVHCRMLQCHRRSTRCPKTWTVSFLRQHWHLYTNFNTNFTVATGNLWTNRRYVEKQVVVLEIHTVAINFSYEKPICNHKKLKVPNTSRNQLILHRNFDACCISFNVKDNINNSLLKGP